MSKSRAPDRSVIAADWRSATDYRTLLDADRRAFAWEWLRRHAPYRSAWHKRNVSASAFGLLAYEDPDLATPVARPIWGTGTDPRILDSRPALAAAARPRDLLDVRALANFVSIAVDEHDTEHWLLTDGRWIVRLAIHDGTLLGGPVLLEHHMHGLASSEPKLGALRQLVALARQGDIPPSLRPREVRAARWIMQLRAADALRAGASHQDMARIFFGAAIAHARWRTESESYRQRVRRLVRAARTYLDDPFRGPWFR